MLIDFNVTILNKFLETFIHSCLRKKRLLVSEILVNCYGFLSDY